ncbi:MAG: hypothetical protein ACI8T1_004455 [Verrucomicrobiales bacterium]|jgi:hypothetical protein
MLNMRERKVYKRVLLVAEAFTYLLLGHHLIGLDAVSPSDDRHQPVVVGISTISDDKSNAQPRDSKSTETTAPETQLGEIAALEVLYNEKVVIAPPHWTSASQMFFSANGELSDELAKSLELNASQVAYVEEVLQSTIESVKHIEARNMKLVSDNDGNEWVQIEPIIGEAQEVLDSLQNGLDKNLNPNLSEILFQLVVNEAPLGGLDSIREVAITSVAEESVVVSGETANQFAIRLQSTPIRQGVSRAVGGSSAISFLDRYSYVGNWAHSAEYFKAHEKPQATDF